MALINARLSVVFPWPPNSGVRCPLLLPFWVGEKFFESFGKKNPIQKALHQGQLTFGHSWGGKSLPCQEQAGSRPPVKSRRAELHCIAEYLTVVEALPGVVACLKGNP